MKKLILFALLFVNFTIASCQKAIDWQKTSNWKLYYLKSRQVFRAKDDTLQYLKNISLDKDTMQSFLRRVDPVVTDKSPVWMGAYLATCQLEDGSIRRIAISQYGGFFWDERDRKYYELPVGIRADWLNYVSDQYEKIVK